MDAVHWERQPELRQPVLVAAFEGWNDAGDAASTAARYLARAMGAEAVASLDPEEFYDFTSTRPQVRLADGITRQIDWPTNRFQAASVPGSPSDVLFLHGIEPQLRWRRFCSEILDVARAADTRMVLTLGALLTETPHSRPVRVTGTAADADLVARLGLQRSRYEGPTGIVGVLHDACSRARLPSVSLWAAVPHYVAQTPSPKAALALVHRAASLLSTHLEPTDLEIAAAAYERQVSEVVAADADVAEYVHQLELADDQSEEPVEAEMLAAEVERFLRGQGGPA